MASATGQSLQVSAEAPAEIHGFATLIQLSGVVIPALALVINYLSWSEKRRDDWTVDKLVAEVKEKLATRVALYLNRRLRSQGVHDLNTVNHCT